MAIRLNYLSAVNASYLINFRGLTYNAIVSLKNNNVVINTSVDNPQIKEDITSAILTHHYKYYS